MSLVAITTTMYAEGGTYRRPQIALYAAYMSLLERLGLTSVLITPAHSESSVEALVSRCGGLLLTGGEDVDPAHYGERPIPELGNVNPARDAMEFKATAVALDLGLPILAICRGCQLLNVHLGGTLYQDLEAQRPQTIGHQQTQPWGSRVHDARVEPASRLAQVIGTTELHINSFHHQAIKDLAPGLSAVGWSEEDGLIEAVEMPDREWVFGVQWHPERFEATAPETDPDRRLMAAFAQVVLDGPRAAS